MQPSCNIILKMDPIIIVDVETTGKRSHTAHVVAAAAVILDGMTLEERDSFSTLANPGEEGLRLASPEAMAVNGLTVDELRAAPPAEEAARLFREFIDQYHGRVHAFNNGFDMWFLARAPWCLPSGRWGECVMLAAAEVMGRAGVLSTRYPGAKPKWPRLDEAASFFGIPHVARHSALGDAKTAARVYAEILRRRRVETETAKSPYEEEAANILDEGF
jgi:DNA polymerase-3 subunit epsilon/CBS domain-containing protein